MREGWTQPGSGAGVETTTDEEGSQGRGGDEGW